MGEREQSRDLSFEGVLAGRSAEKRTALIIFPVVVVVAIAIVFGAVALSRMSSLTTQVKLANQQVEEASKAVEERDQKLREARADNAILAAVGQGGGVLAPLAPDSAATGVALVHLEQHALALYAYDLSPAPEAQQYRVIVRDGAGKEKDVGALAPDDRGGAYLLARDLPEGLVRVEVALLPRGGGVAAGKAGPAGATRQPVLAAALPRTGEAGIVTAPPKGAPRAQGRAPGRRR